MRLSPLFWVAFCMGLMAAFLTFIDRSGIFDDSPVGTVEHHIERSVG